MSIESASDLATFLNVDEFATLAIWRPMATGIDSDPIPGVFGNPFIPASLGEAPDADSQPTFLCRSADVPAAAAGGDAGDTLTIAATTYRVAELQPDGTGMTFVVLAK